MNESEPVGSLSNFGMIVRPVLAGIPYFGGSLATAWSEWDTKRRFSRVEQTLREFCRQLESLKQFLDPNLIGEGEMQLLERVLQQVETEHRDGKRKRFSHLVAVAWTTGRDRPFEEKNRFMQALEEFDELHIGILSFLRQNDDAGTRVSYAAIGDALCVPEEERDERLGPALDRLASGYGFLRRGWLGNAAA